MLGQFTAGSKTQPAIVKMLAQIPCFVIHSKRQLKAFEKIYASAEPI